MFYLLTVVLSTCMCTVVTGGGTYACNFWDLGHKTKVPLGVLIVKVFPELMALVFHKLLLINVCSGILLSGNTFGIEGGGFTEDLTVIFNFPVGHKTGKPAPWYYRGK